MTHTTSSHPLRGGLLICIAVVLFAALDASGKYLSARYPVPFLVWVRYAVHLIVMLLLIAPSMRGALLRTRRLPLQVLRGLMLVATSVAFLAALYRMPLAEATALMFLAPLVVTALAGPVLGEKVSVARWAGAVVGFAGVLLIVRPGTHLSPVGVALALGAMACLSTYHLLTRMLSGTENSLTTLFYTALVGTLVMTAVQFFLPLPHDVPLTDLLLLASLGASGGIGHFLLIRAFHHATASTLMPFTFGQLIWATLAGWIAFGQLHDLLAGTGMLVIGAGGLWVAATEQIANILVPPGGAVTDAIRNLAGIIGQNESMVAYNSGAL